jgi:hypothetical protein
VRPAGALAAALALLVAGTAAADSFTPVRLGIGVAPVARLRVVLPITVGVTADASVLDTRTAPLRIRVKLASECGGTFAGTQGAVLLDRRVTPQPTTGRPFAGRAHGSGKPTAYGVQTVCVWLEEEGDGRVFASDQFTQVNVSKACTVAARRYDRRRTAARRRAARRACGPGVRI